MMFPSNRLRVPVSTQPIEFRKGHGGLAALVSPVLRNDPFTGKVFVFRSRRADRLKLLYWDSTGLVMAYKRLEDARFKWPAIKGRRGIQGVMRYRNGCRLDRGCSAL
jgi:transposase